MVFDKSTCFNAVAFSKAELFILSKDFGKTTFCKELQSLKQASDIPLILVLDKSISVKDDIPRKSLPERVNKEEGKFKVTIEEHPLKHS